MGRCTLILLLSFFFVSAWAEEPNIEVYLPEHFQQTAPTNPNDSGAKGDYSVDDNYIYIHTGTQWERASIASWAVTDKLLMSDGSSKILLDDGTSHILIRP